MPTSANRLLSAALRALPGDASGSGSKNLYATKYARSRRTLADYQSAPEEVQTMWLADYREGCREAFHADLLPHLAALAETEAIRERLQDEAAMDRLLNDFADELADLDAPDTPVL